MGDIATHLIHGLTIRESATDGSDFTNPAADYRRLFLGEDGLLHLRDSAGTVTDIGAGSGIAVTLADAAGDMLVASGADAWAKFIKGADGTYIKMVSGAQAYALPPGHLYNRTAFTSPVTISATSEATATTIVTASAGVAFDGSTPVYVRLIASYVTGSSTNGDSMITTLYDDTGGGAASIGKPNQFSNPGGDNGARWAPIYIEYYFTPSAATHTFSWRAYRISANWDFGAGAGGIGNSMPGYIAVVKAT